MIDLQATRHSESLFRNYITDLKFADNALWEAKSQLGVIVPKSFYNCSRISFLNSSGPQKYPVIRKDLLRQSEKPNPKRQKLLMDGTVCRGLSGSYSTETVVQFAAN